MMYHEDTPIELSLLPVTLGSDPAAKLSKDLKGGIFVVRKVPYAVQMRATLSGSDFDITPSGAQDRTVLENSGVRWAWTVRPNTFGPDKMLVLEIAAIVVRDGKNLPPADPIVFRDKIAVDVGIWDRAIAMSNDISVVHGAVAGVGATLVGVGAWLWTKVRKEKKKDREIIEVVIHHRDPGDGDTPTS